MPIFSTNNFFKTMEIISESENIESLEYHGVSLFSETSVPTVGDDYEWIAAKAISSIQNGVNACVAQIGKDELAFTETYREQLLADDEFVRSLTEESDAEDDEEDDEEVPNTPSQPYDISKDRLKKIWRNVQAAINKMIAKIRAAVDELIQKLVKKFAKKVTAKSLKMSLNEVKKRHSKEEFDEACKQPLPGPRYAVNFDIMKTSGLVNHSEVAAIFEQWANHYGDYLEYTKAANDEKHAGNESVANKYLNKAESEKNKARDIIDKFDRKFTSKVAAVCPAQSSDHETTSGQKVDLRTDTVYNFDRMAEFVTVFQLSECASVAHKGIDIIFDQVIRKKTREFNKHGNIDVAAAFLSAANTMSSKYIELMAKVSGSVNNLLQQYSILLTKMNAQLGESIKVDTGLPTKEVYY